MAWQELVRQIECRFVVKGFPNGMGVDPATGTVYVANFYGNTVSVIDGATSTVTATIGAGKYPDGVGVDPATATVYVANHFDNTVSVIDGATGAVTVWVPRTVSLPLTWSSLMCAGS